MKTLRVHVVLYDGAPSDKEQSIAYLEVTHVVDDESTARDLADKISATVTIEDEDEGVYLELEPKE